MHLCFYRIMTVFALGKMMGEIRELGEGRGRNNSKISGSLLSWEIW